VDYLDLITAIEKVKSGLSNQNLYELGTLLNFTGSHIITSSDSIFAIIPFDLKELGPFSVDAKGFYNIIFGISEEEIELKLKQESLSITSDRTRAKIRASIRNEEDLKNIQKIAGGDNWIKLSKAFMKYLSICSISTIESSLSSDSILKNILVRENLMVSSDSFRISRCFLKRKVKLPKKEILLPSDVISKILNKSFSHYSFSSPFFLLKDDSGLIYGIRIEEGKYKDFEDHFIFDGVEIDFPADLYDTISNSSKFLRDSNDEISSENETIKITLKRNALITKVKRDIGWMEKRVPIEYTGESFSFLTNPKLLEELSKDMTKMIISKEKALFKTDDFEILMVLPYKDEKDGNENEV
jgi:DNA polymerase III sliding clamp (beta) subunit (PCNA family)